jgi:nucleoside-diphosphate-sugar epimerase
MHVFVTGGSGQTGPAIVSELISAGHSVTGLARSDASAARLEALGARPYRGSLEDLDALERGAKDADGVVHMAFGGDYADPQDLIRRDSNAIAALGRALAGTGKPLVSTSGTLVLHTGRVSDEQDPPNPDSIAAFRIPGEQACLRLADEAVRSSVVRLAPTVHGPGDYGFIPALIAAARRNGRSAYIGDGANRWPAVHRLDAARLFRLAVEKAPAGSVLHGVGEGAVTIRAIAEHIGRALEIPTVSLTPEQAAEYLGNPHLARFFALDVPVSSAHTQSLLGWTPNHQTLLEDMSSADYFAPESSARAEAVWLPQHKS